MGAMFKRCQPMSEIRAADYDDLKYFAEWDRLMVKADVKAYNDLKNGKK
jgi:hypothetical protein